MARATGKEEEKSMETKKRRGRKKSTEEQADIFEQAESSQQTTVSEQLVVSEPVASTNGNVQPVERAVVTADKLDKSEKAAVIAEANAEDEESIHAKYERVKKGQLHLTDLQRLSVNELHDIAKKEGIEEYTALKKQDLIFRILKERIRQNGLMYGEGVLEVLPDGFGFLRNPEYNYLSSPDDIYVSPSQIRRFGLRSGNVVSGQIRPPKDSEKYFALLRSRGHKLPGSGQAFRENCFQRSHAAAPDPAHNS